MALAGRVLETIRRHALLRRGERVLVALSGGSDSVALLFLLRELASAGELSIAGIAHLNHGLRNEANDDEQFCRALAATCELPFRSDLVDVRRRAADQRTSLEDAGRRARYEFFARVADELGADVVATGHTRNDQAETVLLRLLRGAGPRGLAGIHPRSGRTIRPLLDIDRAELKGYLAELAEPFRDDSSNEDVAIPRNRIRHELLPLLERDFSPGVVGILAREAEIARQDEDRLQREAIDLAGLIVLRSESASSGATEAVEVDAVSLCGLHPALGSRVAKLAVEVLAQGRFVGFDHVSRLLEFARDPGIRGPLNLPGQSASRQGSKILLRRHVLPQPFANSFRVSLSIPGEVVLPAHGWAVSATVGDTQPGHSTGTLNVECPLPGAQLEQAVATDGLNLPLVVRSRQPGDRFRPLGMGGRKKKLQDVLVDRKVAREERDSLPLVVDSADNIVWVVGQSVAEDFRVTGASQAVIFLKARRLGGQG
jgi:tRNA(Ile)-lysidine synthase